MAGRLSGAWHYLTICLVLIALTGATVMVSFAELSSTWHMTIGLTIGGCKAALVALFFMQALKSERITWMVMTVTLLWVGILFALTLADYITRGQVPFMPGH